MKFAQGKAGRCFGNAGRIIRREGRKHHAWIQDIRTGQVYEVTRCRFEPRPPISKYIDFVYRPVVHLSWEDYSEACFPAGYESIVLPCKHIGCEDERGGIDNNATS